MAGVISMWYSSPPQKRGSRATIESLGFWIPAFRGCQEIAQHPQLVAPAKAGTQSK
jgi:hypothetical protein